MMRLKFFKGRNVGRTEIEMFINAKPGSRTDRNPKVKKEIEIKCPGCGVAYEVLELEKKPVKCMDCGAEYLQPIRNTANPEFIRAAAYRCKGEK
jgi:ribosomal protein S27E